MVNKCAVFGCKRGYESEEPQHEDYHAFYFPLDERKSHLLPAWEKFVCRDGWKPSANSVICEFHFEDRLIRKGKRWTLKWKLNPMPTMLTDEMKAMPQSVQTIPAAPPRKPPAKRTYQEDEINAFLSQDIIGDFSELNSTHAPPGFQCTKSDNSIVFFKLMLMALQWFSNQSKLTKVLMSNFSLTGILYHFLPGSQKAGIQL